MSKQIDERVVSMQFDNRHFESNVQTTMSTLDKLKQKLNFTGASKGLDSIGTAAKNVNMSGLGSAVETVHAKFSALEVMGVTALANITNSAVNAGKRIVSALTIDPIKTGFQEYETQINAVQTILANTESKGTTLDDVNAALEELNKYADMTIYNFTEMTRNIGTFTAAGVDLDTSVNAIKGIANLAAVSGSTSQQASTAMYQLSQALASGTVKLMDWNSVVNAGMGGEVFQNALKETARVHGIAIDDMVKKNGSFRETLKDGWLTSEILTETLQKFTLTTEGLTEEQIKANREMLKAKGYTEEQIDEIFKLGKTATDAATKVKTFTQLWDVLKEAAQSGWAQTWKLIVGDFEGAKNLFSPLADALTGFINGFSNARNKLIEGAMGSPFGKLAEKIKTVTGATDKMKNATDKAVGKFKNLDDVVTSVIRGDFQNAPVRFQKLTEAGYNWAEVQNKVNERLGYSKRYSTDLGETQKDLNKTQKNLTETQASNVEQLLKMSDAQLISLGLTKEEVEAFRELEKQCKKAGISIDDFLKDTSLLDGRTLLINSFKNAGQGLVSVFKALKDAWVEVFPPMTSEQLYNIIAAMHNFSLKLRMSDETAANLKDTFKGLFSALDIILTLVSGPIKIAFKIFSQLLGAFDLDILDVTAAIGRALTRFNEWLDSTLDFTDAFKKMVPYVQNFINIIKDLWKAFKESDYYTVGMNVIQGLKDGLKDGAKDVWNKMIELGKGLLEKIKGVLGIHSPSTEFFEVGKNIIQGLVNGLQNGASAVWEAIKNIATGCIEFVKKIDFGAIFAVALSGGLLFVLKKVVDVMEMFASPLAGIGDIFDNLSKGVKKWFKAAALEKRSNALLNIAKAIGILAASVALLTFLDTKKLWGAIGAIAVLSAIMAGLIILAGKMGKLGQINIQTMPILAIASAILILSIAMKKLSSIEDVGAAIASLTAIIIGLSAIMIALGKFINPKNAVNIAQAGKMMLFMSGAFLIMTIVIKRISKLDNGAIVKGLAVVAALELLFMAVVAITKFSGPHASKAGKMMLLMSGAFLIMITVIKRIDKLEASTIFKGLAVVAALELLFGAVMVLSQFAGENAAKAGVMMLLMSGALLIMTSVIRQISGLDNGVIEKGLKVIAGLELMFAAMMALSQFTGDNAIKAGIMMLSMAGALAIISGVLFILSKIDPSGLGRALGVVTVLSILFGGLIAVTKLAQDCKGMLIVITVAIGLLSAAMVALSLIDPKRLAGATAAISAVMISLGLVIASTKFIDGGKSMVKPLIQILAVVLILVGVVAALSLLDPESALKSTAALAILMTSMAIALAAVNLTGKSATSSVGALALMGLVVAELAVILGAMSYLNVEASMENVKAISVLLLTMSGILVVLGLLGGMMSSAFVGIGALAVLGLVVAELAVILGAMTYFNIEPSIEVAKSLSILLLSMSGALVILGAVGLMGPAAFIGIGALATLITGIGGLLIGIGALMDKFPALESFLDQGIPVLEKIGYALGSFFGNIVGGFLGGVTAGLPEVGTHLSEFMTNAMPFIEGAKLVDSAAMEGIKYLSGAILALTGAELIAGIASFLSGGVSLAQLGSDLSAFMINAMPFVIGATMLNENMMAGVKALAETVLILTAADVLSGLTSWFAGETSLSDFGAQLPDLATSLNEFATNLGTFDETKVTSVKCAADAIKALAEAASALPNEGGWAAKIFGENSIATFGGYLPALGTNLNQFATNLGEFDETKQNSITCAANAIKSLAEAAKKIPNEGGWAAKIFGDNSIATFGSKLPTLGTHMSQFATNLGTFNDAQVTTVKCAANAIKAMAQAGKGIDGQADWAKKIFGDNGLAAFSSNLPTLGTNLKSFADNLGTFNEGTVTSVNAAVKVIKSIAKLADADLKSAKKNLPDFGDKIVDFAKDVADFCENMPSGENLTAAAVDIIAKIIKGVDSKKGDVKKKFINIAGESVKGLKDKYKSFYDAGSHLVNGFKNGISDNAYKAEAKARAMASAAAKAAEDELDINSPSKVFRKIGMSVPEGFAMGIDRLGRLVSGSSVSMAQLAVSGVSKSIARISDIVNTDIDSQPTIRPVLDLSDVRAGAGAINGLFGMTPSVGVLANVNGISSMMNRNQNGSNDDVISAIKDLKKSISDVSGDTYYFGDVRYDDDSTISNAVQEIVRYAKVERRA